MTIAPTAATEPITAPLSDLVRSPRPRSNVKGCAVGVRVGLFVFVMEVIMGLEDLILPAAAVESEYPSELYTTTHAI